jgi:hypothetical protein
MSNLTTNRINTQLSEDVMIDIKRHFDAIINLLPVATLTDDERGSFDSIDVDNKIFCDDVLVELNNNSEGIIPVFLNPGILSTDLTMNAQSDTIESYISKVAQRVKDIKRISGHEALNFARSVYGLYDIAARAGVPNAKKSYDKLKLRFEAQRNGGGRTPKADA